MKPFRKRLLGLVAGFVGLPLMWAQEEIRTELEERKIEIDQKIDDLFGYRDYPIPPLSAVHNPFYRSDEEPVPVELPDDDAAPLPPTRRDSELLAAIADNLAINGIVRFNNRDLVVINQSPTPAGRSVSTEFEGKTFFLRVEEIHSNRVVISMNNGSAFIAIPIERPDRDEDEAPANNAIGEETELPPGVE